MKTVPRDKKGFALCKGFTLVELAIVMTIIGLLIGGVIKGEELLNQARVKRVMKDVESITAAQTTFRDQYSQWPGDMANAEQRLSNCDQVTSFCFNGNGDGKIGKFNFQVGGGTYVNRITTNQALCGGPCRESMQYWKHMALADLITSVQPNADTTKPDYGYTHPSAPFARGYSIMHVQSMTVPSPYSTSGNFLRLEAISLAVDANVISGLGRAIGPSAKNAWIIDTKMDDGKSNGGLVRSYGAGIPACGVFDTGGASYDPTATNAYCLMYFKVGG